MPLVLQQLCIVQLILQPQLQIVLILQSQSQSQIQLIVQLL